MNRTFEKHKELHTAYQISQNFKKWYDKSNCRLSKTAIKEDLYKWHQSIKMLI